MLEYKRITKPEEIRILSNTFRMKIISLFNLNKESLTVKQMADKLGEVPSKVHYHVKMLKQIGVMEIVETREKSGIVEKYYLPTAENFKIDNAIKTAGSDIYEEEQDDVLGILIKNIKNNTDIYRKNVKVGEDDGRLFSDVIGYLTPAETRELHDICVEYIKNKPKREGTKLYDCTLLTVRKYDKE
ncbi:MAG: ArsR/SmtB family transcription factor [Clostridium sp.]|uniref:ArsR/SmtB family transcription factor n=1 Tax=Clostridium sp. TaxID=1506 RepID=UPI003D6CAD9E